MKYLECMCDEMGFHSPSRGFAFHSAASCCLIPGRLFCKTGIRAGLPSGAYANSVCDGTYRLQKSFESAIYYQKKGYPRITSWIAFSTCSLARIRTTDPVVNSLGDGLSSFFNTSRKCL